MANVAKQCDRPMTIISHAEAEAEAGVVAGTAAGASFEASKLMKPFHTCLLNYAPCEWRVGRAINLLQIAYN